MAPDAGVCWVAAYADGIEDRHLSLRERIPGAARSAAGAMNLAQKHRRGLMGGDQEPPLQWRRSADGQPGKMAASVGDEGFIFVIPVEFFDY